MILFNKETSEVVEELGPFEKEALLQKLVEDNIRPLFGLELIESEFTMNREDPAKKTKRLDSLCFDLERRNFVIIEYKRAQDSGLVNQVSIYKKRLDGSKYRSAEQLFDHLDPLDHSLFEGHPNKDAKTLRNEIIKWKNTRVIAIAHSFDDDQIELSEDPDHKLELLEYRRFSNGIISFSSSTKGEDLILGQPAPPPAPRQQTAPSPPFIEKQAVRSSIELSTILDKDLAEMGKPVYQKWKKLENFFNESGFSIQKNVENYILKRGTKLICYFGFEPRKKRLNVGCRRGLERADGSRTKKFFTAENIPKEKVTPWTKNNCHYHLIFIEESSDESDLRAAISLIEQKDAHMRQK